MTTCESFVQALADSPDAAGLAAFEDFLKDEGRFTHDYLLSLVLLRKKEDWPRFIFANWLQENAQQERAEFIRVQLELYGLQAIESQLTGEAWQALERKCRRLAAHEGELLRRLTGSAFLGRFYPGLVGYERGFVCMVRCRLADWLEHGPGAVCKQPVERVEVTDKRPGGNADGTWFWDRQSKSPGLSRCYLVPDGVFDHLPDGSTYRAETVIGPDEGTLHSWLSEACLKYAEDSPC